MYGDTKGKGLSDCRWPAPIRWPLERKKAGGRKQPSVAAQKLSAQKKQRRRSIQDKQQARTVDLTSSDLPGKHVSDSNGLWKQMAMSTY